MNSVWMVLVLLLNGCSASNPAVHRIGILSGADAFFGITEGFKTGMTNRGYIEGKNIFYDVRKMNADPAGERSIAKKFVEDRVDLIVAFPTGAALAAKAAVQGTTIPVVFAISSLEGSDLAESVRRPGGNITGVRFPGPDATCKRLEILHELAPRARRIGLIYDPGYPTNAPTLEVLRPAASALGLSLREIPVTTVENLKAVLRERSSSSDIGIDAILIMAEVLTVSPEGFSAIITFAKNHKIPIGGSLIFTAEHGALFSYTPDPLAMGRDAASLTDKILKGTPAGSLPIVTPEQHLRLNYKAIRELGLNVPEGLLKMATEIIR